MFTVIIPTHDRPALLQRALRSLIAQTYSDFQVVVVDDSSKYLPPYEELSLLQGRYTYVIRSGQPGPAESRNVGQQLIKTRYALFLDDDDAYEPTHLEALAGYITAHNYPEILFSDFKVRHEDRSQNPPVLLSKLVGSSASEPQHNIYVRNHVPNCCVVYRQDVLAGKRHALDMEIYEDWDFLLSCMEGRTAVHAPVNSVIIYKTDIIRGQENTRRGNSKDEFNLQTILGLYKKYKSPSETVRQARKAFMASASFEYEEAA